LLVIVVPPAMLAQTRLDALKQLLVDHPGASPVHIHAEGAVLRLPEEFNVDAGNGLMAELRVLLGPACVMG
ncbi:MAG: hypothetical protein ACRD0D_04975, partial [Acidimicrobiales bacterium]